MFHGAMAPSRIDLPDRARSGHVELDDVAEAFARRAGAQRAVEAQPPRLGIGKLAVAVQAFEAGGEVEPLPRSVVDDDDAWRFRVHAFRRGRQHHLRRRLPLARRHVERRFQRIPQPLSRLRARGKTIDDHERGLSRPRMSASLSSARLLTCDRQPPIEQSRHAFSRATSCSRDSPSAASATKAIISRVPSGNFAKSLRRRLWRCSVRPV